IGRSSGCDRENCIPALVQFVSEFRRSLDSPAKMGFCIRLADREDRFCETYLIIGTFPIRLSVNHAHEAVEKFFDFVPKWRKMFMTVDDPCQVDRIGHA